MRWKDCGHGTPVTDGQIRDDIFDSSYSSRDQIQGKYCPWSKKLHW